MAKCEDFCDGEGVVLLVASSWPEFDSLKNLQGGEQAAGVLAQITRDQRAREKRPVSVL